MTNEAQRTAIAEACGWKMETTTQLGRWLHPNGALYGTGTLPRYLSDLNAMHEAEKVLTQQQTRIYNDELHGIVMIWCGSGTSQMYNCIHATAAHRAEAFLRTLNLWDESK